MPYISNDKRSVLDPYIDMLHNELAGLQADNELDNIEGNLNYIITKLFSLVYSSPSYSEINAAIGVLECCKLEWYRKLAAPYEDKKEVENGRVLTTPMLDQLKELSTSSQERSDG